MSDELDLPADDQARVEDLLRALTEQDMALEAPPSTVWAGIEAQLGDPGPDQTGQESAPVVSLADRRRRLGLALTSVAAAAVLVAGLAVALTGDGDDVVEYASAELVFADGFDPLGAGASATTSLIEQDGTRRIRFDAVDLPAPASPDEDLELWLIGIDEAGDIAVIRTLGIVTDVDDPGTFTVPSDFSTDDFATVAVDISVEPRDGVETHSGRSIVRGPLEV